MNNITNMSTSTADFQLFPHFEPKHRNANFVFVCETVSAYKKQAFSEIF